MQATSVKYIAMKKWRESSRTGFTLVETMITLALSGIVIAAVMSSYTQYRRG
jgi:prepilin-type N-terminal cleavage/methylation domain-containing protein